MGAKVIAAASPRKANPAKNTGAMEKKTQFFF